MVTSSLNNYLILHCRNLNQLVTALIGSAVNLELYIISPIVLLIVYVCMYDLYNSKNKVFLSISIYLDNDVCSTTYSRPGKFDVHVACGEGRRLVSSMHRHRFLLSKFNSQQHIDLPAILTAFIFGTAVSSSTGLDCKMAAGNNSFS